MRILFVCLGNICRSPLAEGILKHKLQEKAIDATVDSVGFEPYHISHNPDDRTIKIAEEHDIDISDHVMRLFSQKDFDNFDKIYVMDQANYRDVIYMARNEDDKKKVDFVMNEVEPGKNKIVPDPYYGTRKDFEKAYVLLDKACDKIAAKIEKQQKEEV